jgi:hypothetical protein
LHVCCNMSAIGFGIGAPRRVEIEKGVQGREKSQ